GPRDYVSLAYLIGLDTYNAKRSLSDNPRSIVERNRRKLSQNYCCHLFNTGYGYFRIRKKLFEEYLAIKYLLT
ncbi:MAG: hypothetical protein QXT67_05770, partial [Candidatus Bathyarchaeia archaeon]